MQNYSPNTRRWQKGDIVIHDADAKRKEFLLIVEGCDGLGWEHCETYRVNYLEERWRKAYPAGLLVSITLLHDPKQWGL